MLPGATTPFNKTRNKAMPLCHAPSATTMYRCMNWDDMIQQVKLPQNESTCTLATGGINVLSDYLDDGIQFSQPTFHGYLGIMIYAEQTSGAGRPPDAC